MKALTLTQPWATLMAYGEKVVETRSWSTQHRGPLAIHAASGFPRFARDLCRSEPFRSVLCAIFGRNPASIHEQQLPTGVVLAVVHLDECVPTSDPRVASLSEKELAFGDYDPVRYAWFTRDVRRLRPFPARGRLSLWDLADEQVLAAS